MRAIRLEEAGRDPALNEVPIPTPGPGEVRIAMRACGICGSDVHIVEGSTVSAFLPITLGHEPAGVVDALGADVEDVQPGQRVAVNPMQRCDTCPPCRRGVPNLCCDFRVLGLHVDGAHADHFLIPATNLVPLPDAIDFATGAIVTDAVATPYRAIRQSGLRRGDTAVVHGLGGLGIHAVILLSQVFGVEVIGVDTQDAALERGTRFGASDVVDAREGHAGRRVVALTDGGADAAFDFVGSPSVVDQALRSLRPGGRCVVVGVIPERLHLSLRQESLVARELGLVGSFGYLQSDLVELFDLVATGRLTLSDTITHRYPLVDYQEGLDALRDRSRGAIRVVITNEDDTDTGGRR